MNLFNIRKNFFLIDAYYIKNNNFDILNNSKKLSSFLNFKTIHFNFFILNNLIFFYSFFLHKTIFKKYSNETTCLKKNQIKKNKKFIGISFTYDIFSENMFNNKKSSVNTIITLHKTFLKLQQSYVIYQNLHKKHFCKYLDTFDYFIFDNKKKFIYKTML